MTRLPSTARIGHLRLVDSPAQRDRATSFAGQTVTIATTLDQVATSPDSRHYRLVTDDPARAAPIMTATPLVVLENVNKHFGELHVLQGHQPDRPTRRGRRRHRPVRLGQVDAVPHDQPAGDHRRRHDHHRRPAAARGGQGAGPAARRRRHGVPVVQPVRPQDDPGERHARARSRCARSGQAEAEQRGDGAARAGRRRRPGRQVPGPALRRPAAARGDRPGAGHEAQGDALRRAHLGARPRDGQGGARRHGRPGRARA